MNNTLKVIALVSLLMSNAGYAQDYDKGLEAFEAGYYANALVYWRPLAEQGDEKAQSRLGLMYYEGQGVVQDGKEAVKWYRLAAEQGNAKAQSNLGKMYARGQGVIQDNVYAHMWFNIAASNGNEGAVKFRDGVAGMMTVSQLEKERELARECVKKNYKGCGERSLIDSIFE